MGHYLEAIIGKDEVIADFAKDWVQAREVKLTQGSDGETTSKIYI